MSSDKRRYRTYIKGFDENLGGGMPENHVVLLAGETGSMKSSLAYYILYRNAKEEGVNGLYLSLEQTRESLISQMKGMGFTDETEGNLEILDLARIRMTAGDDDWFDTMHFAIEEAKRRLDYQLLVVDSLQVLNVSDEFSKPRESLFRFFNELRSMDITTIVVSEMPVGDFRYYGSMNADFLADGIFHASMVEVGDIDIQRRIRCVKMRNTDHVTSYFSLLWEHGDFSVTRTISDF